MANEPDNKTIMTFDIVATPLDPPSKSEHVSGQASAFDDLLPASYRTPEEDVAPPTLNTFFLRNELEVDRLNGIHQWLWLVGRPRPPRPLYYQRAVGRKIVLHEQADVHCVWDERRVFLKPVPRWLLERQVWRDFLNCDEGCLPSKQTQYRKMNASSFNQPKAVKEGECERCELRGLATGFLLTYTSLIAYEHDLYVAKEHKLVPEGMTWSQWRSIVKSLLSSDRCPYQPTGSPYPHTPSINPRYHYGELRLGRLNLVYRLTLRSPLQGYLYGYNAYSQFWSANMKRLAGVFAYIVVVLTAMQVGLDIGKLQDNKNFQRAAYGFTAFSILAPLLFLGAVCIVFLGAFVVNLLSTIVYWKSRMGWIERRRGREESGA